MTARTKQAVDAPISIPLVIYASEFGYFLGEEGDRLQHLVIFQILERSKWLTCGLPIGRQYHLQTHVHCLKTAGGEEVNIVSSHATIDTTQSSSSSSSMDTKSSASGTVTERLAIEAYGITNNNTDIHRLQLNTHAILLGKVDGYLPETKQLIEIKRRTTPFTSFHFASPNDIIQCYCYIQLTGESSILLREIDSTNHELDTLIERNDTQWSEWMKRTKKLVKQIQKLLRKPSAFEMYQYAFIKHSWKMCSALLKYI
jgi:hypothetical protein